MCIHVHVVVEYPEKQARHQLVPPGRGTAAHYAQQ